MHASDEVLAERSRLDPEWPIKSPTWSNVLEQLRPRRLAEESAGQRMGEAINSHLEPEFRQGGLEAFHKSCLAAAGRPVDKDDLPLRGTVMVATVPHALGVRFRRSRRLSE
jgi:hypothetical protein